MPIVHGFGHGVIHQGPPLLVPQFNPLSISGLQAWYSARYPSTLYQNSAQTTSASANGDPVGGWQDLSGNARHLTQATTSKRPTLLSSAQNGLPGIKADGVDDFMEISSSTAMFDFLHQAKGTVIIVTRPSSSEDPNCIIRFIGNNGAASINHGYSIWSDDTVANNLNNSLRSFATRGVSGVANSIFFNDNNNAFSSINSYAIISDTIDCTAGVAADRSELRINGGSALKTNIYTNAASSSNASFNFAIFSASNNASTASDTVICEVLIYNAALTTAQRQYIERNLGSIYGITVS